MMNITDPQVGGLPFGLKSRRVAIMQGARLASHRVPNKLLERVNNIRLIDRGLRLLRAVSRHSDVSVILCCCPEDTELVETVKRWEMELFPLTREAVLAESWDDAFKGMAEAWRDRFDWIVIGNFLCRPFLEEDTVRRIIHQAHMATQPFVVTTLERGLLWDSDGKQIYGIGETANTKTNPAYHRLAHLAYGVPLRMLACEKEASLAKPFWVPLRWYEKVDIDTPDDLLFARAVASHRTQSP